MKQWVVSLLSIAAVSACLLGFAYWYGNLPEIPAGVHLLGTPVGGILPEQLPEIAAKKRAELGQVRIVFASSANPSLTGRSFTLQELAVATNEQEITGKILHDYQTGNFLKRAWTRWNARSGLHYSLELRWDEGKLSAILQSRWPELFQAQPVDAKRIITAQDEVLYEKEKSAYRLDSARLVQQLSHLTAAQLLIQQQIQIDLPMKEIKPSFTVAQLEAEGIERKIAEYTTHYSTKTAGRAHNVEATAQVLNDRLLAPGETFSYREIIQETEKTFGFKPAPVIMEGELRPGIGGGVCQVSTTLYNAVLLSGLDIVERKNHSLPVGYAPLGRDATYTDHDIDFRFKNNTGKNLLIRSITNNGKLTVKIFGTAPANREIEILTEQAGVISPPTQSKKSASLPAGTSKVVRQGKPGYKVRVFKVVKIDGKPVEKTLISTDTYRAQPRVVLVGTGVSTTQKGVSR